MSEGGVKQYLTMIVKAWPDKAPLQKFLLDHGKSYAVGPDTFAGPRMTPKECYSNATELVLDRPDDLTYVEGKVLCHGIPIDHAWAVDANGVVMDPTLTDPNRITDYFGVPFRADYVRRAMIVNGYYGLLDGQAYKTLPKLVELGLDAGQDWLMAQPLRALRRKGRR